jgi:hypothetical protein
MPQAKAKAAEVSAAFVQRHSGRASLVVLDAEEDLTHKALAFWHALGALGLSLSRSIARSRSVSHSLARGGGPHS